MHGLLSVCTGFGACLNALDRGWGWAGRFEVATECCGGMDGREAWDKKYVEVEDEVLFHLILAANFLDIKDLLDLTCKTVRAASLPPFSVSVRPG